MTVLDLYAGAVGDVPAGAVFSPDRRYRYSLWRNFGYRTAGGARAFVVIGLNPSTADETEDDPTIRRCKAFARREGCDSLVMLNLFALRSTDPAALYTADDPIGPDNDYVLRNVCGDDDVIVVAAWGAHAERWPLRVHRVRPLLPPDVRCFGVTKAGHPKHPLYLSRDTELVGWRAEQERTALAMKRPSDGGTDAR